MHGAQSDRFATLLRHDADIARRKQSRLIGLTTGLKMPVQMPISRSTLDRNTYIHTYIHIHTTTYADNVSLTEHHRQRFRVADALSSDNDWRSTGQANPVPGLERNRRDQGGSVKGTQRGQSKGAGCHWQDRAVVCQVLCGVYVRRAFGLCKYPAGADC